MTNKIRVLVAEDSPTARELLVEMLRSDPQIEVIGVAADGLDAVAKAVEMRPDAIVMDIHMPKLDGLEATKRIMVDAPTPVVIVSAVADPEDVRVSMSALRAGALTVLRKPESPLSPVFDRDRLQFVRTVKAMSEVKVVRHRQYATAVEPAAVPARDLSGAGPFRVVAIAASTGGPAAIQSLLSRLPATFPAPMLVVQHIAAGFVDGLATWLGGMCSFTVKVASDGEQLEAGTVYLAPDGTHLGLTRSLRAELSASPPIAGFRPSANHLFESAARACGSGALGIILTGMGQDGVEGLAVLRSRGGYVVAQDEASCVVYGMPGAAVAAEAADAVISLDDMPSRIVELVR
jgi:two-component system chemotaxis response regulator CheB